MKILAWFVLGFALATVVPVFAQVSKEEEFYRTIGFAITATGNRIEQIYLDQGAESAFLWAKRLSACTFNPDRDKLWRQAGWIIINDPHHPWAEGIDIIKDCGSGH